VGSHIAIGFVFEQYTNAKIKLHISKLANYLGINCNSIEKFQVSKDKDGGDWIEITYPANNSLDNIYSLAATYYFAEFDLNLDFLGIKNFQAFLRVVKNEEKNYFGLILFLNEEQLIKKYEQIELDRVTPKVLDFIRGIYPILEYDYAYCDSEAPIEYSPAEFKALDRSLYSVAVIPISENEKIQLNFIFSGWNIDGHTRRKTIK
jgi:hypothetical protein